MRASSAKTTLQLVMPYRVLFQTSGVRFLIAAAGAEHVRPGEAEPVDVGGVDLFERAVAGLALCASVAEPVAGKGVFGGAGVLQDVGIDFQGRLLGGDRGGQAERNDGSCDDAVFFEHRFKRSPDGSGLAEAEENSIQTIK